MANANYPAGSGLHYTSSRVQWSQKGMKMLKHVCSCFFSCFFGAILLCSIQAPAADPDPAHMDVQSKKPLPWPGGVIPYDVSRLTEGQQAIAKRGMDRWLETHARIRFVPRTTELEYVNFTGNTNAGNNTSRVGFQEGERTDINITAFWWRQGEWMPAHELGHVLGLFHEHTRWDRDQFLTVHYENIKPGREGDYDWISKTNWIVSSTAYDYYSIMHYRVCWAGKCESECKDGDGSSPCAVLDPMGTNYDRVIGQWSDNGISATDCEKMRLIYGTNPPGKFGESRKK
jgi:hypothetical protein